MAHEWEPIKPLEITSDASLGDYEQLAEAWKEAKAELARSSSTALEEFRRRLVRRHSVETGIIEHLYDVNRGVTETLVEHGFAEELVARTDTTVEPARLVEILRDQEAAIVTCMDVIAASRTLTKGLLHELHQTLTRNQHTTTARTPDGDLIEVPLRKGAFKERSNNPERPDGTTHEYCPPLQVDTEVEQMLGWYDEYRQSGFDPVVVAAWLHHRFTQIHPYQDGNGRLARTLMNLVMLSADLMPIVIDRDARAKYIASLEDADRGDLLPLARMLAERQKSALLEALSVQTDAQVDKDTTVTAGVLEGLAAKVARRAAVVADQKRIALDAVAGSIRSLAAEVVDEVLSAARATVSQLGEAEKLVMAGGPDYDNAHWYRHDVIGTAHEMNAPGDFRGRWVNFDESHYFVKGTLRVLNERLVLVVSLHHVGREFTGVMEATVFGLLETYGDEQDDVTPIGRDRIPCSREPFIITPKTAVEIAKPAFEEWLDHAVAVGLKSWSDRL